MTTILQHHEWGEWVQWISHSNGVGAPYSLVAPLNLAHETVVPATPEMASLDTEHSRRPCGAGG